MSGGNAMRETVLRALFEGDPTAACLAGPDDTILGCNAAFAALFGFADPGAANGTRIEALLVDAASWRRALEAAAGGTVPARLEAGGRARDGRSLLLDCELRPAADPDLPGGVLAWFSDVTERRAMEREMTQAPRTKSGARLVRGIGHDLGNMMMVIRGFVEVLARELPEGGRGRGWLAQIRTASDRAATLAQELLAAARPPDAGLEEIEPAAALEACLPMLRRAAGPGVEVELRAPGGDRSIRTNRDQFEALLQSLVSLAHADRPKDSRLIVEVMAPAASGAGMVLRVSGADAGRGWEARFPAPDPPA
jgi:PAS domain S-box-containing protein